MTQGQHMVLTSLDPSTRFKRKVITHNLSVRPSSRLQPSPYSTSFCSLKRLKKEQLTSKKQSKA